MKKAGSYTLLLALLLWLFFRHFRWFRWKTSCFSKNCKIRKKCLTMVRYRQKRKITLKFNEICQFSKIRGVFISPTKNRSKNAFFHRFWAFGQDCKKTCEKSVFYIGNLVVLRPPEIDGPWFSKNSIDLRWIWCWFDKILWPRLAAMKMMKNAVLSPKSHKIAHLWKLCKLVILP